MQKNPTNSLRCRTHRPIIDRRSNDGQHLLSLLLTLFCFNVFEDLGCRKVGSNISRVWVEVVGLGYFFRLRKQRRTTRVKKWSISPLARFSRSMYVQSILRVPSQEVLCFERERWGFSGAYFCPSQMCWQVNSTPVIRSYVWVDCRRRLR